MCRNGKHYRAIAREERIELLEKVNTPERTEVLVTPLDELSVKTMEIYITF